MVDFTRRNEAVVLYEYRDLNEHIDRCLFVYKYNTPILCGVLKRGRDAIPICINIEAHKEDLLVAYKVVSGALRAVQSKPSEHNHSPEAYAKLAKFYNNNNGVEFLRKEHARLKNALRRIELLEFMKLSKRSLT